MKYQKKKDTSIKEFGICFIILSIINYKGLTEYMRIGKQYNLSKETLKKLFILFSKYINSIG